MSKSDGGFIILQDIIEKGFNPLVYRLMCLGTHYRKPLSYSETALKNFNKVLNNIISNYQLLLEKSSKKKIDITDDPYLREFKKAINNDMNMPVALSQYYEVITNDTFHSIDERIELAKEILDKHIYWTNFFDFLEIYTIPNVYFGDFSAQSGERVQMIATSRDLMSLAQQIVAFDNAEDFYSRV